MDKLKQIVTSKPLWIVLLIFAYIVILGILKWQLKPDITTVYYLLGGIVGIYFMDAAEEAFSIHPSPFQSIIFVVLFGVVSFFVITSSGNMFASGLVLSLFFTLLLDQAQEWQERKNLDRWYSLVSSPPPIRTQQWIVLGTVLFLVLETVLFIR